MRSAYQREALSSCSPPTARSGCDIIVRHFQSEFGSRVDIASYLILLPALVGMFVERRSARASSSTGRTSLRGRRASRRRWLLTKTLLLALAVAVGSAVLSAVDVVASSL